MENKISNEKYKEILEKIPICCVDLVIHNNKKVLLVNRKNHPAKGEWWFPGGRIYKNEKLDKAVIRKAKEETGLDVKIQNKVGFYEFMFNRGPFPDLKRGVHTIGLVFIVKLKNNNQKIKIDETHSDFKWVDKIEKNLPYYVKEILKDSNVFPKTIIL